MSPVMPGSRGRTRWRWTGGRCTHGPTSAMQLRELPESLVVIGAGYVGWSRLSSLRTSVPR